MTYPLTYLEQLEATKFKPDHCLLVSLGVTTYEKVLVRAKSGQTQPNEAVQALPDFDKNGGKSFDKLARTLKQFGICDTGPNSVY